MKCLGVFLLAGALTLTAPAAINPATAAPQVQRGDMSDATDFSAHRHAKRHHRHHSYSRPQHRPYYYDRPAYYRPYPYISPVPFTFGIGFDPAWW